MNDKRQWLLLWAVAGSLLLAACSGGLGQAAGESGATERPTAGTSAQPEKTPQAPDQAEEDPVADRSFAGTVPAPDFPPGLDWLNTDHPISLAQLKGKVVLLDFWTYGCINCIHIIPDLKRLEEKYRDELVVIGVHSAKFSNEGQTDNIRRIIMRYELEHPVVNDNQFLVWQTYGAQAWPTLVLIDPEGKVIGSHSGEGIYDLFDFVIGNVVKQFDNAGLIDRTPLETTLESENQAPSPLRFPGKVLADGPGNRLFIADSNHNRIVVADLQGNVLEVIGRGSPGFQDGDYETAQFFRPQGLTLADEGTLYVADTENQAIRRVDLQARLVQTVAGTGQQAYTQVSSGPAGETPLNSPWDVLASNGLVYIAMAGQHQLWWYDPATEMVNVLAGSRAEELRDGPQLQGGLNQPSGLATDGRVLYFADPEASAIRSAGLTPDGVLQTIVGTGLFDFGDVDGVGSAVRLQHPLALAFDGKTGQLYVADTYNSKIKRVDPASRESHTLFGGPGAGWRDGAEPLFDEPGGLSLLGQQLYIADTNNHVIRVADLARGEVSTLVLVDREGLLTRQPAGEAYAGKVIALDAQKVSAGHGEISLAVTIPQGYKLNDIAPFSMAWSSNGEAVQFDIGSAEASIVAPRFPLTIPATFAPGESTVSGDLVIYYCEAEAQSLCLIEQVRLQVPLVVGDAGSSVATIAYAIPDPPDN